MEVIGFTSKYYTLWDVNEHIEENRYGKFKVINHTYIKNISYDLDKAKSKYPEATLDTSLHGHTTWRSTEWIEHYAVDEFQGGKYKGEKISECKDYSYLCWAYDLGYIIPYESRNIALSVLENAGYRQINDYHIATPEEVAEIEKSFEETEEAIKILEESGKIEVFVESNINEDGNIKIGNIELNWEPEKYKSFYYNGYWYYLPVNAKGQSKRIKGKKLSIIPESYKININEYGWGAILMITVKDFEIIK